MVDLPVMNVSLNIKIKQIKSNVMRNEYLVTFTFICIFFQPIFSHDQILSGNVAKDVLINVPSLIIALTHFFREKVTKLLKIH